MSYQKYTYTFTRSGNFFRLNFTSTESTPFSLPTLQYINRGESHFQITDRISNGNLVTITDGKGAITIDFTKCTSFTALTASSFITQALAL